jgi:hypothetical protein
LNTDKSTQTDQEIRRSLVRILSQALPVVAILTLVSGVTIADTPKVDPETLPKVECTAVRYSADFLNKYPKAPAACLEARVYKGQTYIKVKGSVYIPDKDTPTIALKSAAGDDLGTVTAKDPKNIRLIVNGKETDLASLRGGQSVTIWVPESMFAGK